MAVDARGTQPSKKSLADSLRRVRVGVRDDLEVTRQVFRGEPCYIVHDPLTFENHRFSQADYEIFVRIDASRTLGEIFERLVASDRMSADDEERFYRFVTGLHRLGFLRLPIVDDKRLYRRYRMRQQAKRRARWTRILFLRIPLWNPDRFLTRTIRRVKVVFSWPAFLLWAATFLAAMYVAGQRWEELADSVHGVLAARNLALIWITLIVLKVFHEFGHAYACKHFGGYVPEMGAFLVVFTPCAYMDASAAWGFSRKAHRIIVSLAGMYIETWIASIALLLWAFLDDSLARSIAYNIVFLAGIITVAFNINPLMRYDGYYVVSDLVEVPNLRARATAYLLGLGKRLLLGVREAAEPMSRRLKLILTTYGVAIVVYRTGLMLAIAALVTRRFQTAGLVFSGMLLGGLVLRQALRLLRYLWYAEELGTRRRRAVVLSFLLVLGLPAGLVFLPVPGRVYASAVVRYEQEDPVRAEVPGFVRAIEAQPGGRIARGCLLARLESDELEEQLARTRAQIELSRIRLESARFSDPVAVRQERLRLRTLERDLQALQTRSERLDITAPRDGILLRCLDPEAVGAFLAKGAPVALIASGSFELRVLLTADQSARLGLRPGDAVEFQPVGAPSHRVRGVVRRVVPVGGRRIAYLPLTHLGGGDIAVDPKTLESTQPYFEVVADLPEDARDVLTWGVAGTARFEADPEPVALALVRRAARFWNRVIAPRG
ncbi:MAG: hypothetical protein D6788_06945 [Planctomycetota bacterium]|nr:MAG: hypothetical protein D6788_06945 [Planctomycetota bacterium]